MQRRVWGKVGQLMTSLLQISWKCAGKRILKIGQLLFDEVDKNLLVYVFDSQCI